MHQQIKLIAKDLAVVVIIFILISTFSFQSFHIPSGSMEPTLEVGDRVFVSKFSYGYNRFSIPFDPPIGDGSIFYDAPERGDVTVFTNPTDDFKDIIKRVIGLPGDSIQMKNGRLYINGEIVKRELVRRVVYTNYRGDATSALEYDETLPGGLVHRIYERGDSNSLDNTPLIVVPAGHFFMMGDNRDSSADSRTPMGPVRKEYLVGRAVVTTFSLYDCDQGKDIPCKFGIPFGRFFKGL
jgi:signal peptidase I